jgi:phenylacetate 2-hydroxylase
MVNIFHSKNGRTENRSRIGGLIPFFSISTVHSLTFLADVDHFGPTAGSFNPERWLKSIDSPEEAAVVGFPHLSFGSGSRGCSSQLVASRLPYTTLVRILSTYKIVASETEPPKTDYVGYNQFNTALVAIPVDFEVKLVPRDARGDRTSSKSGRRENRTVLRREVEI